MQEAERRREIFGDWGRDAERWMGTVWMTARKPERMRAFLRRADSVRRSERDGEPRRGRRGGTGGRHHPADWDVSHIAPLSGGAAGRAHGAWCAVAWSWLDAGPGTKEQRRRAPGAVWQGCRDTATQGWHVVFVSVHPDWQAQTHTEGKRERDGTQVFTRTLFGMHFMLVHLVCFELKSRQTGFQMRSEWLVLCECVWDPQISLICHSPTRNQFCLNLDSSSPLSFP